MTRVGILYHPFIYPTHEKARELYRFLKSRGDSAWLSSAWETGKAKGKLASTSIILTVGGDGTILRAAQVVIPGDTPIVGINLGKLGFMTEFAESEALDGLSRLMSGEGWKDDRAMLEVELTGDEPGRYHALNDVVVARGAVSRVIYVSAHVNGQRLATYKADGVVLATATGSTGYSLAAGGPVLYPQSRDFLITPIVPHLSLSYPIVLPASARVTLEVKTVHPATLSIDGHINRPLPDGARIEVRLSPCQISFLRLRPPDGFFGSLVSKLKGSNLE